MPSESGRLYADRKYHLALLHWVGNEKDKIGGPKKRKNNVPDGKSLTQSDKPAALETADMDWYVYLLRCADDTLYTGITTDLFRRLRQHNGELAGGAKYTRAKRPVQLVWSDRCASRSEASIREAWLKKLSRGEKLKLALASNRTAESE